MIQTYNANRDTDIKDGKVTVSFGFSVEGITPGDARKVEREIDLFLARISAPPKAATGPKQFTIVPWSSDEKATVLPCKTREEAWQAFHEQFPDSPRHKATVTRWWDMYHREPAAVDKLPESVPDPQPGKTGCEGCEHLQHGSVDLKRCDTCSPPVKKKTEQPAKKKGKRRGRVNKYGIPQDLFNTDNKLYQRLWARCKAQGIMYAEALAMEGACKTRSKRASAPVQKPAENVPERSAEPDNAVSCFDRQPPAAPAELAPKDKVVYTGSPKMFHGTAEVVSAKPGYLNVVVDIGNGRMECNRSNLAKVGA